MTGKIYVCKEIGNDEIGDGVKVPYYSLAVALRHYPGSEDKIMVRSGPSFQYKNPSASELKKAKVVVKIAT
jgi:hypothetical protein